MILARIQSILLTVLVLLSLSLLSACSNEPETGPAEVRWDRETCERCLMAVSDRHFSAQIRGGAAGEKQKLYKFDDLGCAVIWLDQQVWKDNPLIEIWVNNFETEEWIDARTAHYVKDRLTPMNYGLGAQSKALSDTLSYSEAKQHIYKIEEQYNLHNGTIHTTPFDNSQYQ